MDKNFDNLAQKAQEASKLFKSRNYAACLDILEEIRKQKPADSKVLHNIAIVEFYNNGCQDSSKLLRALAESQAAESGGSSQTGDSVRMHETGHNALVCLNMAVVLWQTGRGREASMLLEPLFSSPQGLGLLEPLEEGASLTASLLLLTIHLQARDADKVWRVIEYLESAFGYLLDKGDGAASNSSAAHRSRPTGHRLSLGSHSGDEEGGEDDALEDPQPQSSTTSTTTSVPPPSSLPGDQQPLSSSSSAAAASSAPRAALEDRQLPISPQDFRLYVHFFKARVQLLWGAVKLCKREVKCTLNAACLPPPGPDGQPPDLSLAQTHALLLKAQVEMSRQNYKKATKLLFSTGGGCPSCPVPLRAVFLANLACVHLRDSQPHTAHLLLTQALALLTSHQSRDLIASSSGGNHHHHHHHHHLPPPAIDTTAIFYNNALQNLLTGNFSAALKSFHLCAAQFSSRPLFWLRLAECCVAAHMATTSAAHSAANSVSSGAETASPLRYHRGPFLVPSPASAAQAAFSGTIVTTHSSSHAPTTPTPPSSTQVSRCVNSGPWRRLLLPVGPHSEEQENEEELCASSSTQGAGGGPSAAASSSSSSAVDPPPSSSSSSPPPPSASSSSLARPSSCLLKPELSLEYAAACLRNAQVLIHRSEQEHRAAESTREAGSKVSGEDSHKATEKAGASDAQRQTLAEIRRSVCVNLAHLHLLQNHPLGALNASQQLLDETEAPMQMQFLARTYAAEALCLLGSPAEAIEHLFSALFQQQQQQESNPPAASSSGGARQVAGGGGPARPSSEWEAGDEPRPSGGHSLEVLSVSGDAARAALYVNLAALYASQDDWRQAQQCALQALSIAPTSSQALLSLVYVEMSRGHIDVALSLLKHQRHAPHIPPSYTKEV